MEYGSAQNLAVITRIRTAVPGWNVSEGSRNSADTSMNCREGSRREINSINPKYIMAEIIPMNHANVGADGNDIPVDAQNVIR
jgi:hypothetical protein